MTAPPFLFVTCQVGAEKALKQELARTRPELRFAYSRPGFVTFKAEGPLEPDLALESVFARAFGLSLGKAAGDTSEARAAEVCRLAAEQVAAHTAAGFARLHVWPRDQRAAGDHGYEPGLTEESQAAEGALRAAWPAGAGPVPPTVTAPRAGEAVLDVVLVEPELWWVGWHKHGPSHKSAPGGLSVPQLPPHAVSRAYAKMAAALDWAELPLRAGERVVELGASPGGASQALLDRGLEVTGIDPAEIHPDVLAHPKFTHFRKRTHEVRRREFRKTRWLFADMNVAPQYTLDSVEGIVTFPETDIRGMILTLKLPAWELADQIPAFEEKVRGWGFAHVRCAQLAAHRQEIALAATVK